MDILGFGLSGISPKPKLDEVDELDCWLVYSEGDVGWILAEPLELIDEIDEALHRCTALPWAVSGVVGGVIKAPDWLSNVVAVAKLVTNIPLIHDAIVCRRCALEVDWL